LVQQTLKRMEMDTYI